MRESEGLLHRNKSRCTYKKVRDEFYKIKEKTNKLHKGVVFLVVLFFIASLNIFYATIKKSFFEAAGAVNYSEEISKQEGTAAISEPEKIKHLKTPESVKAIYMSSWVAGTRGMRENLINFIQKTEINAVVIDVKDFSGKVFIKTDGLKVKEFASEETRIPDIKDFIDELHNKNIYVIAKTSVFQDDYLTKKEPHLAIKNKQGGV